MLKLNSNTLATWCEELTHWKRPWYWERLRAGEGNHRGWDGWMASATQWTWVWVDSGSWWWAGRSGMLHFMGSQRVGHDWPTELNWTESDKGNTSRLRKLHQAPLLQYTFWRRIISKGIESSTRGIISGHKTILAIKILTWILKKGIFPSKYIFSLT